MNWIPCKEELPQRSCQVLLTYKGFTGNQVAIAQFNPGIKSFEFENGKSAFVSGRPYNALAWILIEPYEN